jgi:flagellar basal-body rod modification protein FlgD
MLVAQLENQDPMNPQDSAAFAAQLAQFSSVEQLIAMRAGIDQLVAASNDGANAGNAVGAGGVDPTNLIGRWVTVYGGQIEVDDARSPVELDFRSIESASEAEVVVTDATGNVVHRESVLPTDETGTTRPLPPGDHVYRLDPARYNLGSGVYGVELRAKDAAGEPVTLLPMARGQVSGAILAGEPSIRIGSRVFSVDDVLEVRLSEDGRTTPIGG